MLTIHVWPRRLKEFLLTHPLYKSPIFRGMSATGGKFDSRTQSHESPLQLPRSAEQI